MAATILLQCAFNIEQTVCVIALQNQETVLERNRTLAVGRIPARIMYTVDTVIPLI